jgi:hypothetical protein
MDINLQIIIGAAIGAFIGSAITSITQILIFKNEREDKYRMLVIEQKLAAQQKAFSIWNKIANTIHDDSKTRTEVFNEAAEFWTNNCLYLDKDTMQQFKICMFNYSNYPNLLEMHRAAIHYRGGNESTGEKDALNEAWNQIMDTVKYIMAGARFSDVEIEVPGMKPGDKKAKIHIRAINTFQIIWSKISNKLSKKRKASANSTHS